jgi:hypothetical protein
MACGHYGSNAGCFRLHRRLATGGRVQEDGPALFEMGHSSAVRGLMVWYPEQQTTNIVPYSWTFHLQGNDNTVENVTVAAELN